MHNNYNYYAFLLHIVKTNGILLGIANQHFNRVPVYYTMYTGMIINYES